MHPNRNRFENKNCERIFNTRALRSALLGLVFLASSGIASAPRAEAYLIKLLLVEQDAETAVSTVFFCSFPLVILTLPVCAFSEKTSVTDIDFTRQELLDSSYSEDETRQILTDRNRLYEGLKNLNAVLAVGPDDTRATLTADIRQVVPDASDLFIEIVMYQANLK